MRDEGRGKSEQPVDLLICPEPHQHRQECLCHINPAEPARMLIPAKAGVAQTLLSVLSQAAAIAPANPGTQ